MKNKGLFFISLFLGVATSVFAGTPTYEVQPSPTPTEENHRDLFDYELDYTGNSSFFDDHGKFGNGNSLYNGFSYAHRFLITGKWYFRAGVEYERFDFDIPAKAFFTFPLKKDKIFAVIGVGFALNQNPIVAPGGGIIWLFNDHLRLEGVFPEPALVYNPWDNWEFRIFGNLFYESFRTDDVITPERKLQVHNAWVQYSEDRVGVLAKYSGFKPFNIKLGGGCTVKRDFDFFRAEASAKTRPAPYVQVEIEARF